MAYENTTPEMQAVSTWLDALAIQPTSAFYEKVLNNCQGVTQMLGQTAVTAITRVIVEAPSRFLPMSSPSKDMPSYAWVGQQFGAHQVCLYENENLSPDDAMVKFVGERYAVFTHYMFSEVRGHLYLPYSADFFYRPVEKSHARGLYSIVYIGRNALACLKS